MNYCAFLFSERGLVL